MTAPAILAFSVAISGLGEVLRVAEPIRGASLDNAADYSVFSGDMTKASAIAAYGVIDGWCERIIATTPLNARTNSANAVCNALGPLKNPALRDWRGSQTNALVANPAAIAFVRDGAVDISKGRSDGTGGCTWLMPWSLGVPEIDWTSDTNAFDSAELWWGRLVRTSDIARQNAFGAAKSMMTAPFHIGDYPRSSDSLGWELFSDYNMYLYSVWGATYWDEDGRDEIEQDGRLDPYAFLYARPVIALMGKALVETPPVSVTHHATAWFRADACESAKKRDALLISKDESGRWFCVFPTGIGAGISTPITTNVVTDVIDHQNASVARAETYSESFAYAAVSLSFKFAGFVSDVYADGNLVIMEDAHVVDYATKGTAKIRSKLEGDYSSSPSVANATITHVTNDLYDISYDVIGDTLECELRCTVDAESVVHAEVMREAMTTTAESFGIYAGSVLPHTTDIYPEEESVEVVSIKTVGTNVTGRTREIACESVDLYDVTNAIVSAVKSDADVLKDEMSQACGGLGYEMIPLQQGGAADFYSRVVDEFEGSKVIITDFVSPEIVVEKNGFAPVAAYVFDDASGHWRKVSQGGLLMKWTGAIDETNDVHFEEHSFTGSTHTVTRQMMEFDWHNYKGAK